MYNFAIIDYVGHLQDSNKYSTIIILIQIFSYINQIKFVIRKQYCFQ